MDRLNTATSCAEWAVRFAASATCALLAVANALTFLDQVAAGRVPLAAFFGIGTVVCSIAAVVFGAKGIRRVRRGPSAPPGEGL